MARFEKGKGKRRTFWDTALLGHVLSVREWSEFDRRLAGYRPFPTAEAAGMEQAHLASAKVKTPDEPERGIVSQHVPGDAVAALVEAHDKQKIELAQKHGPPVKLETTMRGLADSVEAASLKFSGH